jgi:hypothetical protein
MIKKYTRTYDQKVIRYFEKDLWNVANELGKSVVENKNNIIENSRNNEEGMFKANESN